MSAPTGSTRDDGIETRNDGVTLPPEDLEPLLDLALFLERHPAPALLLGPDGEQVPLPAEVYGVLLQVVDAMRRRKAISVAPRDLLLTTQEAADLLGVSRPTVVKMLEEGAVPFEKPNRHRRVRLEDLLEFQLRRRRERRATLNRLTEETGELGIGDRPPDAYTDALRSARRRTQHKR